MSDYRYQLEKYRGRGTRYVCPQCHRKGVFTRYVDTYNNIYISDNVGKCDRLDKCGYHYTPKQYYTDNPWKSDDATTNSGSLRTCGYHYTPKQYYTDNPWKSDVVRSCANIGKTNERTKPPRPIDTIPEWIFERSRSNGIRECVIARLGASRGNLKERIKEFKELKEFKENNDCALPNFPKLSNFLNGCALSAPL